jgi:hypothetical protein
MKAGYPGKASHKITLPLLAERGEGRGEESTTESRAVLNRGDAEQFREIYLAVNLDACLSSNRAMSLLLPIEAFDNFKTVTTLGEF